MDMSFCEMWTPNFLDVITTNTQHDNFGCIWKEVFFEFGFVSCVNEDVRFWKTRDRHTLEIRSTRFHILHILKLNSCFWVSPSQATLTLSCSDKKFETFERKFQLSCQKMKEYEHSRTKTSLSFCYHRKFETTDNISFSKSHKMTDGNNRFRF